MSIETIAGWRQAPPVLARAGVSLREVQMLDRRSLIDHLATPEVTRFVPAPPADDAGFARFVAWAMGGRRMGHALFLSVLPSGYDRAVGVMCLHTRVPGDTQSPWNWGFALGSGWWGTGLFLDAAQLTLEFAFTTMALPGVEAWSLLSNGRVHGAMAKLGATPELRRDTHGPDGRFGTYVKWQLMPPPADTVRHRR